MKKLLFLLISLFAWGVSTHSQESFKGTEIDLYKDNDTYPEDAPKTRGIIVQPASAYLYNKAVTVTFEEIMPSATIKITQESTGDTVYSQEYMSPSTIFVDLSLQDSGTYYIEIVSDTISLEGEFIL